MTPQTLGDAMRLIGAYTESEGGDSPETKEARGRLFTAYEEWCHEGRPENHESPAVIALSADRDRYRAALVALDEMKPNDFKVGQAHLAPAFREVNVKALMRFVCRIVNGVLHNTDEYGDPLGGGGHE